MFDEFYPVQFIEGINECAEYEIDIDDDYLMQMGTFARVAIEYKPSITSLLSRAEIYVSTTPATIETQQIKTAIYSDYNGNPSDIALCDPSTFQPEAAREQRKIYWQKIQLTPVVLLSGKVYWLVLDVDHGHWSFILAKDGQPTNLRVTSDKRWRDYKEAKDTRVMVRFFGRIIHFGEARN